MQFPTRPVTVDCVVFDGDAVVLIKRGHQPFKGSYALPGGFVDLNESVEEACRRETLEETGLVVKDMRVLGVYSDPARDTFRHTVAVAFVAEADLSTMKAGDDAAAVEVVKDWRSRPLAFDHKKIIEDAWKAVTTEKTESPEFPERKVIRESLVSQPCRPLEREALNRITEKIIGCAIKVHRLLGVGFLESVYKTALAHEFAKAGIAYQRELPMPVTYDGVIMDVGFRCDFLVENAVIVECKVRTELTNADKTQTLNYLKASKAPIGLLFNFHSIILKSGIKRMINKDTF